MKLDRIQPVTLKTAHARRAVRSQYIVLALVSAAACVMVQYFYLAAGISGALDGRLPDTDDYMRVLQAMRWLDGGGWHDMLEPRLNPPAGVWMHWSRLVDLPLAAVVATLQPFLGRAMAINSAIVIVPAGLLMGFFQASAWLARPVLGRANGPLLVMLACLPYMLVGQFMPGRVDHHAWQIILATLMVGALIRLALRPHDRRPAVIAALAGACGLWIGGDIIPWVALVCGVLAVLWITDGERWLGAGRAFGAWLFGATLFLIPVAVPPARWFEVACDGFSLAHVGLAGAVALFWLALPRRGAMASTPAARAAIAALAGVIGVGALVSLFPECRYGPYGPLDARLRDIWLANVSEARPLSALFKGRPEFLVLFLGTPLLAAMVTATRVFQCAGRARRVWLMVAAALLMAFALSAWQIRSLAFTLTFALLPLTWLIIRPTRHATGLFRVGALLGGVLSIGFGMGLLLPLAVDLGHSNSVAAVANSEPERDCEVKAIAALLSDPQGLGSRPALIAGFVDHGPEILYRTPHSVFGAPYHRNGDGILDTYDLFRAADPAVARGILQRRQVDLVLLCPAPRNLKAYRQPGATTFAERLAAGETPGWLKPIAAPEASGFLLYQVR
jgi:hypothetical protein